ncbi:hypothetical protein HanXRQr2_Chr09g0388601 [Helianthus annuus]|uniref:Uncharacterized protein n=1 Tax=Helianthus annuus TaxID=4232 RepID=A0A9K3I5N2_HELAN|nr:hypothetical protein HanXRQr2_Chr09g0388601 [Helianthus annuus]
MPDGSPDVYVHPMMRPCHLTPISLNLHPASWVNSSDSVTGGQWVLVVVNGIMLRSSPHFPITAQRVNVPTEATTMRHGGVGATIR